MRHLNSVDRTGYQVIQFPKFLKKEIEKSIILILNKKSLSINKKLSFNRINSLMSKKIMNIKDDYFLKFFGHLSYRYISGPASKKVNKWIRKNIFKVLDKKKSSMHYSCVFDRRVNKSIKKKQFCIYFRCVRPNKRIDVGQPHRDSDFWKLTKKSEIPEAPFKFSSYYKIWIPIYGCNNKNSLKFYHGSNLDESIKTKFLIKKGRKKPYISKNYLDKSKNKIYQPIKNFNNQAVLFSDRVIHFAPINENIDKIRLSVEATIVTN